MRYDLFGQPTSLESQAALEEWNAAQLAFLAHGAATPKHLGAVLAAEPGFALGQAVRGLFMMLLGRREMLGVAAEAQAAALAGLRQGQVTQRERLFVEALTRWIAGRPSAAVEALEQVLAAHPDDVLAMKLGHAIRFVLGDGNGMRASIERVLPAYAPDHAGRGYLLGCHAFALEETGAYDQAEIAGRQALWMAPDDAWGLHAVAHVHDMTCDARAGLDWLDGREAAWAHCNNFRFHVWWHKALMHLDLGQVDAVMALYDAEVRKEQTDDYRDISNATSLLARLELEGVDVGHRWDELAELCAARTEDGSLIFADLHYLLALTASGDAEGTARLVARIASDGQRQENEAQERMADPGLAAARGLQAFGEGEYGRAFADLAAARATMQRAGGSHAQRDVFERITIDAGLRAGRFDAVEELLNDRRRMRAGRDDQFAAIRRDLILAGRGDGAAAWNSVPAQ
ncbi:tetratricopeptide repeat protein [Marinibacterium sp. SX1]|uniref:tetratricopeptide repeat protein n=1 Tax=Marinibacterium sp. SX1 TaxID=3388424 RepID=UPI003D1695C9